MLNAQLVQCTVMYSRNPLKEGQIEIHQPHQVYKMQTILSVKTIFNFFVKLMICSIFSTSCPMFQSYFRLNYSSLSSLQITRWIFQTILAFMIVSILICFFLQVTPYYVSTHRKSQLILVKFRFGQFVKMSIKSPPNLKAHSLGSDQNQPFYLWTQ